LQKALAPIIIENIPAMTRDEYFRKPGREGRQGMGKPALLKVFLGKEGWKDARQPKTE